MTGEFDGWHKTIAKDKDRLQSSILAWVVGILLVLAAVAPPVGALKLGLPLWPLARPLLFSAGFALLVWLLRAATTAASFMGFLICFILAQSPEVWTRYSAYPVPRPAVAALVAVFVLSFAATKFGRAKKEARGLSESRHGRKASQIVANLGVAALFATAGRYDGSIAALAEAAADTVSSEVGQAAAGPARLLTTWRSVPEGTDGGISLIGTAAGLAAAAVIVAIGAAHDSLSPGKVRIFLAASAGLFFDSLLGATAERHGWIGNDLVNFASTLVAALIATALS
ncbi:DUF92 domain-containing protein [Edaphobacter aggregans]|uniref:DUF92 domain-containing protein n=1 Tax=Edaphobacter aggregans TaxID=570835 RepID=UPI000553AB43|nr:DUF92 domain-containing protein [Edaphobacter aggregans]